MDAAPPSTINPDWTATVVAFLRQIGLRVTMGSVGGDSFLPGVCIEAGALRYDPARLRWPGDLLHEAGHLAVMTPAQRAQAGGTLDDADADAGEIEAIAWSAAAALHLGLPLPLLFHAEGYRGQSEGLALTYGLGMCPGLPGLQRIGLAPEQGLAGWPRLRRWLREAQTGVDPNGDGAEAGKAGRRC